ncbi:hypothetical protein SALBM311S_04830 [Streptomyces alboniger]
MPVVFSNSQRRTPDSRPGLLPGTSCLMAQDGAGSDFPSEHGHATHMQQFTALQRNGSRARPGSTRYANVAH